MSALKWITLQWKEFFKYLNLPFFNLVFKCWLLFNRIEPEGWGGGCWRKKVRANRLEMEGKMHNFNQGTLGSGYTLLLLAKRTKSPIHPHTYTLCGGTYKHFYPRQPRMLADWEGSLHFMRRDGRCRWNANRNNNNHIPGRQDSLYTPYTTHHTYIHTETEKLKDNVGVELSGRVCCVHFWCLALFAIIACTNPKPKPIRHGVRGS